MSGVFPRASRAFSHRLWSEFYRFSIDFLQEIIDNVVSYVIWCLLWSFHVFWNISETSWYSGSWRQLLPSCLETGLKMCFMGGNSLGDPIWFWTRREKTTRSWALKGLETPYYGLWPGWLKNNRDLFIVPFTLRCFLGSLRFCLRTWSIETKCSAVSTYPLWLSRAIPAMRFASTVACFADQGAHAPHRAMHLSHRR